MHGQRVLRMAWAAIPLAVLVVFFFYPVAGMLGRGLWPQGVFAPADFIASLSGGRVGRVVWFTLWSSATATMLAVLLGVPVAFVLHRLRFPGQGLLQAVVFVPFVMPTIVVGIAFRRLLMEGGLLGGLGLDGSPGAIVAAMVFFNISVVVRSVGAFWADLDPRRGQAAMSLGASPLQVFTTITLPALLPAIVAAAGVVFLFCATAFGIVLILGGLRYANLETEIYLLTTTQLDLTAAAALSVLQLTVLLLLLTLTYVVRRDRAPVERHQEHLSKVSWRQWPVLLLTAFVLAFLLLPLVSMGVSSLRREGAWTLANYAGLLTTGVGDVLLTSPVSASITSLITAFTASAMALSLGMIVAVLVTRRHPTRAGRRIAAVFDGIFMLPLGVSAVTVGFGLLITVYGPPMSLGGSWWLVPIAQSLVALPLVVRAMAPVLSSIDDRQLQAAAALGASPSRVLLSVELPLAWRSLVGAFGFAFAVSLGEFGATSFLVRQGNPTLPVVIYQLLGRREPENFTIALAAAVLLAATTTTVILAAQRLRPSTVGVR